MTDLPGIAEEDLINFGQTGEYGAPNIPAWKKSAGFAPLETLPAAWFNGYMNELDTHINQLQNLTLQIQTEMANLMSAASVTPSATNLTQIKQAIQALIKSSDGLLIAPEFDAEASYTVGQYVLYNGYLYICSTDHTGAWDSTHFNVTKVGTKLQELKIALDNATAAIGDLSSLTTTAKTDLVSAINEVDGNADANASAIGDLNSLSTTDKTDLVSAINEVAGHADDNTEAIGDLTDLETTTQTDLVSAINEVKERAASAIQYSTNEFDTGKKWIDNKKIYGKVIDISPTGYTLQSSALDYSDIGGLGLFSGKIYAGTSSGLYVSTDGTTFTRNYSVPSAAAARLIQAIDNVLYYGSYTYGLYTSTDGESFTRNADIPSSDTIYDLVKFSGKIYAGTSSGLYVSTDGTTFTKFQTSNWNAVQGLCVYNSLLYVGTTSKGLWTSADGTSFTQNTSFSTSTGVGPFGIFKNALYAGCGASSTTLYMSTDGSTFTQVASSLSTIYALLEVQDTLYVGTGSKGIYTSTDGLTFAQDTAFTPTQAYALSLIDVANFYIGSRGLYKYSRGAYVPQSSKLINTIAFQGQSIKGIVSAQLQDSILTLQTAEGTPTQAIIEYTKTS